MNAKDSLFKVKSTLNINGNLVSLDSPKVMGILNVTPDSFYSGSRTESLNQALQKAEQMVNEGAFILDVGGYSTRPGAEDISIREELDRVIPVIEAIGKEFPETLTSIDTFRSTVAKEAVDSGAAIINDVSGGNLDPLMFETVAATKVVYILMHMCGTPATMQSITDYEHLTIDISRELQTKIEQLKGLGMVDIIVDPGFGFAKTINQNYEILRNLGYFKRLKLPLLAGLSRKSMIYKTLDIMPEEALNGTTALNMVALQNGASILRVHDVKAAVETVKLFEALSN